MKCETEWISKEPIREWFDLVYVTRQGYRPDKVPEEIAQIDFIKFCPTHRDFYYVWTERGCFDCYMEKEHGKKKQEPKKPDPWGHWYHG